MKTTHSSSLTNPITRICNQGGDTYKTPSGIKFGKVDQKLLDRKMGDVYGAKWIKDYTNRRSLKTPSTSVYHPKSRTYTPFNNNGLIKYK